MTTLERWIIIFLMAVAVIAWNYLIGCAAVPAQAPPLPPCEKFVISPAQLTNGDPLWVLTQQDLEKMMRMIYGIHKGTCRLEE